MSFPRIERRRQMLSKISSSTSWPCSSGTLTSALWAEVYGTKHIGAIKALAAGLMVLGSALGPALTGGLIDAGIGLEAQYMAISAYMVLASILVWMGVRQIEAPVSASA
jgi:hypothetical protein